jgi:hypothetical protein
MQTEEEKEKKPADLHHSSDSNDEKQHKQQWI